MLHGTHSSLPSPYTYEPCCHPGNCGGTVYLYRYVCEAVTEGLRSHGSLLVKRNNRVGVTLYSDESDP